jgi:uncharacterized protein YbbC (DUF1343 family)
LSAILYGRFIGKKKQMDAMTTISLGLEQLIQTPPTNLHDKRLGLLCNSASVDHDLVHSRLRLHERFGDRLTALYSPQHGLFAEKQDNMVESDHRTDPLLRLPVFSLYSQTRIPSKKMFDTIDTLLIDLQDVGTRVYTFIYTMSYCLEAAAQYNKQVIVLDRPNPIGGSRIEGNCLQPQWRSFVGRYPLPMRHGLTIAELAQLFNRQYAINCALDVIPMQGWKRDMLFTETDLPWVAPSPNLPTPVSALVYPGQVIWEGTNVSEGRGTTQPFELFGAPYIDPLRLLEALNPGDTRGVILRPVEFEPTAHKWQGQLCRGFQLHVSDARSYQPYRTSLALLQAVHHCHGDQFKWKSPPYEYEYERMPIDLILGDKAIRESLTGGASMGDMMEQWSDELAAFDALRRKYFLYKQ